MESEFKIAIFCLKMIVKRGLYSIHRCLGSFLMIHFPKTGVWSTWRTSGMPNGEKFTHKEAFNNYLDKNRGRGVNRKSTTGHVRLSSRRAWKNWQN